MDLVYFVVLVGALIFVHELGHFVWAKAFGVKVLRFSIGFGPKIAGGRLGETEYVLAAFPIGGYVKMLGENAADVVREEDRPRSFGAQPLWKRVVIVLAGPAMNLVFPLALFFLVYLGEGQLTPPVVGTVYPHRPADGRLLPGDRVLAVDGEPIATFEELTAIVRDRPGETLTLTLERDGEEVEQPITPQASRRLLELERIEEVGRLGIVPHHATPVVGVLPGTSAHQAGLRTFDTIIAAEGRAVDRWIDLEHALAGRLRTVPVTYLRPEPVREPLGGLVAVEVFGARVAALQSGGHAQGAAARAGLEAADLYVRSVDRGSAEAELGLRPGDRIATLDGRPVRQWATLLEDLRASRGAAHALGWRRGDTLHHGTLRLAREEGVTEHGQPFERVRVGMRHWVPMRVDPGVENPRPVLHAAERAWASTEEMVSLTVYSVLRLLQGRLGVESLGGPLVIFDAAGKAAREGATNYLKLMAFISVNLGLINLLPIPLLDGGHLLFFLVEGVTRRPVPKRIRGWAALAGLVLLIALMILALKNDLQRRFGAAPPSPTPIERRA